MLFQEDRVHGTQDSLDVQKLGDSALDHGREHDAGPVGRGSRHERFLGDIENPIDDQADALTFAGVIQVHLQRVLGQGYMDVQDQLAMFYWVRLGSGVFVAVSALMFVWAVLVPGREKKPLISSALQAAE